MGKTLILKPLLRSLSSISFMLIILTYQLIKIIRIIWLCHRSSLSFLLSVKTATTGVALDDDDDTTVAKSKSNLHCCWYCWWWEPQKRNFRQTLLACQLPLGSESAHKSFSELRMGHPLADAFSDAASRKPYESPSCLSCSVIYREHFNLWSAQPALQLSTVIRIPFR
jgi:hypothetical protein